MKGGGYEDQMFSTTSVAAEGRTVRPEDGAAPPEEGTAAHEETAILVEDPAGSRGWRRGYSETWSTPLFYLQNNK